MTLVGKSSLSRMVFVWCNTGFLIALSLLCIVPFIHVLAVSFSSSGPASVGMIKLWPVEFTLRSYQFVLQKPEFLRSLGITCERVFIGVIVNMFLTIITAYPLSKEQKDLHFRMLVVWFFVFTILFSGGLIPTFMVVQSLGLLDSIWALVLPGALPIFNTILLLNFFRGLPKELEESAFMDGASHWTLLWKIFVPLSIPALATLTLFSIVGHWNDWFSGMIFMNSPKNYPLQTYMQSLIIQPNSTILTQAMAKQMQAVSDRTVKSAQIFIGTIPVLAIYPFLQKYFVTGLVMGSVKE